MLKVNMKKSETNVHIVNSQSFMEHYSVTLELFTWNKLILVLIVIWILNPNMVFHHTGMRYTKIFQQSIHALFVEKRICLAHKQGHCTRQKNTLIWQELNESNVSMTAHFVTKSLRRDSTEMIIMWRITGRTQDSDSNVIIVIWLHLHHVG